MNLPLPPGVCRGRRTTFHLLVLSCTPPHPFSFPLPPSLPLSLCVSVPPYLCPHEFVLLPSLPARSPLLSQAPPFFSSLPLSALMAHSPLFPLNNSRIKKKVVYEPELSSAVCSIRIALGMILQHEREGGQTCMGGAVFRLH